MQSQPKKVVDTKQVLYSRIIKKIKFLCIGGLTALIYYSALYISKDLFKFSSNLSVSIAYFLAVLFHFTTNKLFVFQEKELSTVKIQIIKYLVLILINYVITVGFVSILSHFSIGVYIGAFIASIITVIFTYTVMKKIIFRKA